MDILQQLCYLILLFFVYSVAGWCIEVILKFIQYRRFINRGFLTGPYCPIYGSGAVFITVMVALFGGFESSVGLTFVISFVDCGILEYVVGWYMEKRFHARWWDYSQKPMNLHGRIWIGNLVLFGIGGTVIIEVFNPIIFPLFYRLSETGLYIAAAVIVIVMGTDYTFSHFIMKLVKVNVENSAADNTEDIGKEIRVLMSDKSIFHSRLVKAYPEVVYYTDLIEKRQREMEEKVTRLKEEIAYGYQLTRISPLARRDEVIRLQEQLIAAYESGPENAAEVRMLQEQLNTAKKELEDQNRLYRMRDTAGEGV